MNLEELEAEVTRLEDIQEIENLERIYGYYFDTRRMKEILDPLFGGYRIGGDRESRPVPGQGRGQKNVFGGRRRRRSEPVGQPAPTRPRPVGGGTVIIQIGGVITLAADGKTAKGRWHTWLAETFPFGGVMGQYWLHGYYENEFVKERGKWLFKKLFWNTSFYTRFETGWMVQPIVGFLPMPNPDNPPTAFHPYPSGYHFPYSFPHPITGEVDKPEFTYRHPMAF